MSAEEVREAPWPDYGGNRILDGDTILHPDGTRGVVRFLADFADPSDQWRVEYGNGDYGRLCLQIGDKGRAVVLAPCP